MVQIRFATNAVGKFWSMPVVLLAVQISSEGRECYSSCTVKAAESNIMLRRNI